MLSAGICREDQVRTIRDYEMKRARIVAHRGVIELQEEGGDVLLTLIFEARSTANTNQACKRLLQEALTLGYTVFDMEFQQV